MATRPRNTTFDAPSYTQAPSSGGKPKPKERLVVIHNKLPQLLTASVRNESGAVVELKLAANAASAPVADSRLTEHTRRLAELGHVRIRPA